MTVDLVDSNSASPAAGNEPLTAAASQPFDHALQVLNTLKTSIGNQVLGRDEIIELVLIALFADGHVLLEDYPGSGKTTLAKALGDSITAEKNTIESSVAAEIFDIAAFRRIQFTPDLLPSDVTGVPVFDSNSNEFIFRHGPIFAYVLLADEINRTSPKVQAAMLEAMGEKQVTVDNKTYPLDDLFFVIATQNPLDLAGTYPLPTPQLDRFLFKITMDHIDRDAELDVLATYKSRRESQASRQTVSREDVLRARNEIEDSVHISPAVQTALVDISRELRSDDRVLQGNSTRSMVLLLPALQVAAALKNRDFVSADDIERLLPHVLRHRIELAPGVSDFEKVLNECMSKPMEALARSTLSAT